MVLSLYLGLMEEPQTGIQHDFNMREAKPRLLEYKLLQKYCYLLFLL